jgi:adenosylhomocysteinase
MAEKDRAEATLRALAWVPTHLFEMGATLIGNVLETASSQLVLVGLEATGSGISLINKLARGGSVLGFPVFNCDDVPIKEGLHNRHLVGLSTWNTFMERTSLSLHGRHVLVVGLPKLRRPSGGP